VGRKLGSVALDVLASSRTLAKRMFGKNSLFRKKVLSTAMGLAGRVPFVSKLAQGAWKAVLFAGQAIGVAAGAAGGGAMAVLRSVATRIAAVARGVISGTVLLGALVVVAAFSAIAILNYLFNKLLGKGIADTLNDLFSGWLGEPGRLVAEYFNFGTDGRRSLVGLNPADPDTTRANAEAAALNGVQ